MTTGPERRAPLRVAMVITDFHVIGGAERQLMSLAPVLQAHGVDVRVVTRRHPGLESFGTVAGVPVYRLPAYGTKATRSILFTLCAVWRVMRLRPDLVHAHELYSPATVALISKKLLGIPVVAKVPRGGELGSVARLSRRAFGHRRVDWLRQQVDMFVSISREIDDELAAIGVPRERRVSIPNGVDTELFAPRSVAEKERLRRLLDLPVDGLITVYTGRLVHEKGLDDLLSVWPEVRGAHPGAMLLLVGQGELRGQLESLAGEGVRFIGPTADVTPYLQAAELFVLPSMAEGLSNALLEAMACGLPAVATTVGGTPDLIEHGRTGWLVPPGEPDLLRRAILGLLADKQLRETLGRSARLHVESHYSLLQTASRMRQLYRRLL